MNQGRIWCVVNPTVGLPLLLGSVTTIALLVHASVLGNTTWMSGYWQGGAKAKVAQAATPNATTPASNTPAYAISVTPVNTTSGQGATSFVVTVTPNGAQPTATAMVADTAAKPASNPAIP
jgi:light-harvesting protein B-800-850 alpha chain